MEIRVSGSTPRAGRPIRPVLVDTRQKWTRFSVQSQVVCLRRLARMDGPMRLRSPQGVRGFVLDSVSTRDPRRTSIDVWTSRNRVATVESGRATLERYLDEVSNGSEVQISQGRSELLASVLGLSEG